MTVAAHVPFTHDLNAVADSLEVLRRRVCAYTSPVNAPSFCDCKYGLSDDSRNGGEQTGCPELRDAIRLLRQAETTDAEELRTQVRMLRSALDSVKNIATNAEVI